MRRISAICLFVAMGLGSSSAFAQGEADPGLASTGAMRTTSALKINEFDYENQRAHLSLGHTFAKGERDIRLNISQAEVRVPMFGLYSGGYFDLKVPIFAAAGELYNTWGLGDVSFSYTHMFLGWEDVTVQGTAGLLLGMGTANQTDGDARPLPMAYQPSRGSTDAFIGGSATWKQYVTVAAGYQQPVYRYNENDFFAAYVPNDTFYSSGIYEVARKLYRQGDVMLRVEGHYTTERAGVTAGAFGIYHVKDDLYQDRNTGLWHEIDGTQGLTLNVTGNVFVRFGRYGEYKLDVTGSTPVIARRDVYSSGLYRQWMITPRFTYFFGSKKGPLMF